MVQCTSPSPCKVSSLVLEPWGFIWALRRPPAGSWVPQGPYSQGASGRGCLEQVDIQRVSRTRPQGPFLPHRALGLAELCLCLGRRGEGGSHRSPDVLCGLSGQGLQFPWSYSCQVRRGPHGRHFMLGSSRSSSFSGACRGGRAPREGLTRAWDQQGPGGPPGPSARPSDGVWGPVLAGPVLLMVTSCPASHLFFR